MKKSTFCLALLFVLFSCNSHKKEKDLEVQISGLNNSIAIQIFSLDKRAAAISNIGQFSDSLKQVHHYDSLVKVQSEQTEAVSQLKMKLDSLQTELNKLQK